MLIYNRLSKEITTCRFLLQTPMKLNKKKDKSYCDQKDLSASINVSAPTMCKVDLEFLNQPVVSQKCGP